MTEEEKRDRLKQFVSSGRGHPLIWVAERCYIRNKDGELEKLHLNRAQRLILKKIEELQKKGKPCRLLILKARQLGVSSFALGLFYCLTTKNENKRALIACHNDKSSVDLFSKAQLMYQEDKERLPTEYTNRRELIYKAPSRSVIKIETAGSDSLGRGSTYDYFHGSEISIWTNAKITLNSALQTIPRKKNTIVILESTANGVGGEWYERYQKAKRGESEYVAIFIPWYFDDSYRIEPPDNFRMTQEEQKLAEQYKLDTSQIYWRRLTLNSECGGDKSLFSQEYPISDSEAFITSGRKVFNPEKLQEYLVNTYPPEHRGELVEKDGKITFEKNESGIIEIWQLPQPDKLYVIGADVAEGMTTEGGDPDYSAAHVLDVQECKVVAKIHDRITEEEYARLLRLLGKFYGNCLLGFEKNGLAGGALRECLKKLEYPNLFFTKRYNKLSNIWTEDIGWRTDKNTKGLLISEMRDAINKNRIEIPDVDTVDELIVYSYDEKGKMGAVPGSHDDLVISLGIAFQMLEQAYNFIRDDNQYSTLDEHVPGYEEKVFISGQTMAGELFKIDDDVDEIFD